MTLSEAIAFGQYSGHESPQRILAEKVIELSRENTKLKSELLFTSKVLDNAVEIIEDAFGYDEKETIEWLEEGITKDMP